MINSKYLYDKANRIVKITGTRNPVDIADALGIDIYWNGDFDDLLGLYSVINKKRAIVLNNRLEEYMMRMVLAHEIGHDTLHRDIAKDAALQEFVLFDMKNQNEYEANIFASHVLLDTDEILELVYGGYDVAWIASTFCVNINLVLIKLQELARLGYDIRLPMDIKRNFLKDIKI